MEGPWNVCDGHYMDFQSRATDPGAGDSQRLGSPLVSSLLRETKPRDALDNTLVLTGWGYLSRRQSAKHIAMSRREAAGQSAIGKIKRQHAARRVYPRRSLHPLAVDHRAPEFSTVWSTSRS